MKQKITGMAVTPDDFSLVSEFTTLITIDDEGAGEYLRIQQPYADDLTKGISICKNEWPEIKAVIEKMFENVNEDEQQKINT